MFSHSVLHRRETLTFMANDRVPIPKAWLRMAVEAMMSVEPEPLSRRKLATKAHVSNASITRLFDRKASWNTVVRVAEALGLPPPVVLAPTPAVLRLAKLDEQQELRPTSPQPSSLAPSAPQRR